jgi:ADP-ribose pyrophosphatase YjhB (NUDIX family)
VIRRLLRSAAILLRKAAWEGERLRWRLFHPVTLGARVILLRDNEVLLIRHTYRDGWYFPGGGVDKGETLEAAARREAEEEAMATVGEVQLLGVYANFREGKSDHVAVFYTSDFELEPFVENNEIAAREWFTLAELPETISPATRERLTELAAGKLPRAGSW